MAKKGGAESGAGGASSHRGGAGFAGAGSQSGAGTSKKIPGRHEEKYKRTEKVTFIQK